MIKITAADVIEHENFRFSAEASTLGIPPGQVPKQIDTDLGNGQPFVLCSVNERAFEYRQSLGCIALTIFND